MEIYSPINSLLIWQIAVIICLWHILRRVTHSLKWLQAIISLMIILIPFIGPVIYLISKKKLKPLT